MTNEQRRIIEAIRYMQRSSDAIKALDCALGTCGTCAHANDEDVPHHNRTICTKSCHFYGGKVMQKSARCESWESIA